MLQRYYNVRDGAGSVTVLYAVQRRVSPSANVAADS